MKRFMVIIILFFACNKKDRSWNLLKKPEITTSAITNIGTDADTGGGSIISDGGSAITRRGVCWQQDALREKYFKTHDSKIYLKNRLVN